MAAASLLPAALPPRAGPQPPPEPSPPSSLASMAGSLSIVVDQCVVHDLEVREMLHVFDCVG